MNRNALASLVAPVFLRLVLGVTFLWAGLGKVIESTEFTGADAALLAKWNVSSTPGPTTPASKPDPDKSAAPASTTPGPAAPVTTPDPTKDGSSPATTPATTPATGPATTPAITDAAPIRAVNLYHIALMIHRNANPAPKADGSVPLAIVPAKAAEDRYPVILAWAATTTEIAAGVCVLIGFLTRLSALSLAGVMAVAIWLTQIGPAIASGTAKLGFLPVHDTFDVAAWQPLLWQFSLLGAALALLFAGAGMLSLDRLLFHRPVNVVRVAPAPAAA